MAKIPNNQTEYDKLEKRLRKYVLQVLSIYDSSNLEAAKIALLSSYDALSDIPFRFDDYPELKDKVRNMLQDWVKDMEALVYAGTSDEWKRSNEIQDLLANGALDTYKAKHGGKEYTKYYQTNSDALKAFQQRKDKGMNLSQKIWNQSEGYKESLETAISTAIQRGTSAITLSKQISKYLNDFQTLQKDYTEKFGHASNARDCEYKSIRLARNEINMAYCNAEELRWQQMDFIVGYEIKLSHSHPVFDICDLLKGKYPKNFKWSLWHPNCLCYRVSIMKTDEEFWSDDPNLVSKNEVRDVPDAFKKWVKENRDRIARANEHKTLPYFIRDNKNVVKSLMRFEPSKLDSVVKSLSDLNVEYKEVKTLSKVQSTTEIVARVGGGDLTRGSCASLAFAFAGNRCGFDVLDFRDGVSRKFFSSGLNLMGIAEKVGGIIAENSNDFTKAKELIQNVQEGKEYYFTCARHAAIIRKKGNKFEYLELQSSSSNGFKPLTSYVLRHRFGAKKSHTVYGQKYKSKDCIIDIDLLKNDSGFRKLLGYINTEADRQRKGITGSTK